MSIRQSKRKKRAIMDLDITSLLDILVILLVFLLKSFNSSDLVVDMNEKIELPKSSVRRYGSHAIQIQVTKQGRVWMNNKELGIIDSTTEEISFLKTELEQAKEDSDKKNGKTINIVMDESIPYSMMSQIMHTAALSGFPKFKFIVQGNF